MQLFVSKEDKYCANKIAIAAAVAGISLTIKENVSETELLSLDPKAKSMVLKTKDGTLTQHLTILRYIGELTTVSSLNGATLYQSGEVDQWLEFSWMELEVPLQTLAAIKSSDPKNPCYELTPDVKIQLTSRCDTTLRTTLSVLESHVQYKTFFVGERLTIADISFYAAFDILLKESTVVLEHFPALLRWYLTVGYHPIIATKFPLPKMYAGISEATDGADTTAAAANDADRATATAGAGSTSTSVVVTSTVAVPTGKWSRRRVRVKELYALEAVYADTTVTVKGWIRTIRTAEKGKILFVELSDGSTVKGLQLVLDSSTTSGFSEVEHCGGAGASLSCEGKVVRFTGGKTGQSLEVYAASCAVLGKVYADNGEVNGKNYPMSKKAHTMEFLRENAHLRARSRVFSSAMRLRHAMAYATHKFFNERGFVYTHTPIITAADCEGAGEQFVVTSLLPETVKVYDLPVNKATGTLDYSRDYFNRRCCLTVSGQLNVETHACALTDVYTFGPTFRAEESHTSRHLAEFWMIEPEICFATLKDDMALAEDYVKYCALYALSECADDLAYFEEEYPDGEKGLRARLRNVVESDFAHLTYTEAIDLLQRESAAGNVKFVKYPNWGDDLGSEHERYMAEKIYCRPTIVTDYPKGIKAFYMKVNEDGKTVAAMDILVPKIGELIGGSQREDNFEVLEQRCRESGLDPKNIWWYTDLRKYGSVPHAGFGLGFERLVMFVTGLENIRDVIPFPRVPGHAEF